MLHDAARKEKKDGFLRLVNKLGKASVHAKERDYEQTPLHCACDAGNKDVVQLLLDKFKVDVNAVDKNGWTPLHAACNNGSLAVCELLLARGAHVRAVTTEGATPLHYFIRHNYRDPVEEHRVLKVMFDRGVDVNAQNRHGDTALHQATLRGRETNVLYLLNNRANANVLNRQGDTPLHVAVRVNQAGVMKVLLQMGADPYLRGNNSGPSALELAEQMAPELCQEMRVILNTPTKFVATVSTSSSSLSSASSSSSTGSFLSRTSSTVTPTQQSSLVPPPLALEPANVSTGSSAAPDSSVAGLHSPTAAASSSSSTAAPSRQPVPSPNASGTEVCSGATAVVSGSSSSSSSSSIAVIIPSSVSQPPSVSATAKSRPRPTSAQYHPSVVAAAAENPVVSSADQSDQQPVACMNCARDFTALTDDTALAQQIHFHTTAPHQWLQMGPDELKQRGRLSYDLCVIDNEQFFIKGLLELRLVPDAAVAVPRSRTPLQLVFGVWVKVPREYFAHTVSNWNVAHRDKDSKSKSLGELASVLPSYPDTLNLQVMLHTRERGKRHLVEVQPADHPLSFEQDGGVSPVRVRELIRHLRKPMQTPAGSGA